MLNSSNKPNKSSSTKDSKLIAVIKNSMSEQEMDESGADWANHTGPYMTVAETLAHAAKRNKDTVASKTPIKVGDTITFGEEVEFTDFVRELDEKISRDAHTDSPSDHDDSTTRSKESDNSDERISDREHHHH